MPIDNVLDVTPRVQYVASASQTAFDYPFPIFADADLVVIVDGVTKTLTTHYTVSGEGDDAGGTVTFLSGQSSGAIVTIYRDIAIQRTSDFQTNGPLSSDTFNDELDRLTLVQQELKALAQRAVRLPFDAEVTDADLELDVSTFASKYLAFDADGKPTPAALSATTMTQATIGALLNPRTDAETAALVTPADYSVPSDDLGTVIISRQSSVANAILVAAVDGIELVFLPGDHAIAASTDFTVKVRMLKGAKLTVATATHYLKFSAGFSADLAYCLDTDGPTQFLYTEKIYPQWFGLCGLESQDSTEPMVRAFRACRASTSSSETTPGTDYGCREVFFISGCYRCNEVPVYCGTVIRGQRYGSLFGSVIQQIDRTLPGLQFIPKNYGLTDTVMNNSIGQNFITDVGFRSEAINDGSTNEPICRFYGPTEATTLMAISGDTAGSVGHVDTMFEHTWWKDSAGHCIGCEQGQFAVHIRSSIFDVVRGGVVHRGDSYGSVRVSDTWFYVAVRNALENISTNATNGVNWYLDDVELKAGNCQNGTAAYRNALYYNPSNRIAGTEIIINDLRCKNSTVSASRFGGRLQLGKVETLCINGVFMQDPDSASNGKAMYIDATVVNIKSMHIKSDTLASYTNARLITFGAAPTVCKVEGTLYNTAGTAIPDGIQADAAVTGAHFDVRFYGSFTAPYDTSNLYQADLRNSIHGLTVKRPGAAAPTAGTWSVGDVIENATPTVGQPIGWACTVAGTPGTWVAFANL